MEVMFQRAAPAPATLKLTAPGLTTPVRKYRARLRLHECNWHSAGYGVLVSPGAGAGVLGSVIAGA